MRALLVTLVALAVLSAGCLGATTQPPTPPSVGNGTTNGTAGGNATLPDGRGESAGIQETNKTEKGVGGVHHMHDYWKGRSTVTVFDGDVDLFAIPVFPDGEGSQPKSVAYVKLPRPNLVYEGTTRVELTATLNGSGAVLPASPLDPALSLQFRSAADSKWRDPAPFPGGRPYEIAVGPKETDMPHSVSSLWVFRITSDKPSFATFHLKIVIFRGAAVVDWPGHPDFYADRTSRVIADKDVKTHMGGAAESFLYDQGGTWAPPDKLVSYGTTRLDVFVNVTKIASQTGQDATSYFLEYHNATIIGPEITFGTRTSDVDKRNDLKHYHFKIPVAPDGMDGPYQPESRWGFRAMATFAEVPGVAGLCPGCFSYDIQYHLTVVAVHESGPTTPAM